MDIRMEGNVAIIESSEILINTAQEALDLMATVRYYHECDRMVLPKACFCEAFFDLKTTLAGEILQKYTNYQMKLGIVGDFSTYDSKALRDFIYESNRGTQVFFLLTNAEAIAALQRV